MKPGLLYKYYEGEFRRLPDFYELKPVRSGAVNNVVFPEGTPEYNYGLVFEGYIKIDRDGLYEFYLTSDDGSKMTIDNKEIILNDGLHAMIEKSGALFLNKGFHKINIAFFQLGGGRGLNLKMKAPDGQKEVIDDSLLYHIEE
ncbi:PA14 domain-containing protein [Melioribacter sp. Ez-97]|uniref:PA14 domain-containing protein n=1 Tax=Melioribacter sp. Ez-97 TaxID=3423434 RepID=UPI003ED965CE